MSSLHMQRVKAFTDELDMLLPAVSLFNTNAEKKKEKRSGFNAAITFCLSAAKLAGLNIH